MVIVKNYNVQEKCINQHSMTVGICLFQRVRGCHDPLKIPPPSQVGIVLYFYFFVLTASLSTILFTAQYSESSTNRIICMFGLVMGFKNIHRRPRGGQVSIEYSANYFLHNITTQSLPLITFMRFRKYIFELVR